MADAGHYQFVVDLVPVDFESDPSARVARVGGGGEMCSSVEVVTVRSQTKYNDLKRVPLWVVVPDDFLQ